MFLFLMRFINSEKFLATTFLKTSPHSPYKLPESDQIHIRSFNSTQGQWTYRLFPMLAIMNSAAVNNLNPFFLTSFIFPFVVTLYYILSNFFRSIFSFVSSVKPCLNYPLNFKYQLLYSHFQNVWFFFKSAQSFLESQFFLKKSFFYLILLW